MLQLCKMFDCCKELQQENRKHTFYSENSSSRIDRIYANNDVKAGSARVSPNQFSDHDILIAQFNIPLPMVRGRGYWKNNVTCFQVEKFLKEFEIKCQSWKETKNGLGLGLVDRWMEVKNKKTCDRSLDTAKTRKLRYRKRLKITISSISEFTTF